MRKNDRFANNYLGLHTVTFPFQETTFTVLSQSLTLTRTMYGCMDDEQTERMLELMEARNQHLQNIEHKLSKIQSTLRTIDR